MQDYGLGTGLGIYQLSCQLEPIPSDWLFGLKRVVVGKVVLGRVKGGWRKRKGGYGMDGIGGVELDACVADSRKRNGGKDPYED